jgi:hypothetical protein
VRRLIIFLTLILIAAALFRLRQYASNWHYIVPVEPGQLVYVATFEDGTDDWEVFDGRNTAAIRDGTMLLNVTAPEGGIYSAASPYFADFDMTVEARQVDGSPDNSFGVVFRQRDRENYYVFLISSTGFYQVKRLVDGKSRIISNWHTTDLVNTEPGATNLLRVIGYGDHFQFFINDEPVELCIPNDPSFESTPLATGECRDGSWQQTLIDDQIPNGRIAVGLEIYPETGITIAFDNVIVYGPQPIEDNE